MNLKIFGIFGILIIGFILFLNFNLTLSQTNTVSTTASLPAFNEKEPGKIINQFYDFFLIISGLLAFAVIVYGGIKRILAAGNTSKISDANEWIKNAAIGLLLLFGAYIILKLINPNLVNLKLPELQGVVVEKPGYMLAPTTGGLSHEEAKGILNEFKIGVKSTNTTLEGIKKEVLNELIIIKNECDEWFKKYYPNEFYKSNNGCYVFVTGGTESGYHSTKGFCTHENGYKVDIALWGRLDEFIEKNYCKKIDSNNPNKCIYYEKREDGALLYKSPTGAIYAKEENHWDIQIPCR